MCYTSTAYYTSSRSVRSMFGAISSLRYGSNRSDSATAEAILTRPSSRMSYLINPPVGCDAKILVTEVGVDGEAADINLHSIMRITCHQPLLQNIVGALPSIPEDHIREASLVTKASLPSRVAFQLPLMLMAAGNCFQDTSLVVLPL
jgi:hypothetical protein